MKQPISQLAAQSTAALLVAALIPGCAGVSPGEGMNDALSTVNDIGAILRKPTSVWDVTDKIHHVGHLIGTIEKYQRLSQQQKAQVERIAQQRYDRLVESKKSKLASTYKAKKKTIAAQDIAPAKKEKELAKVDKEWYAAARADAKEEYGSGFAVPVTNSSGKPVVAFARIDGDKAVAASDSYVLASSPKTGNQVAHSGGSYTVVSESIR